MKNTTLDHPDFHALLRTMAEDGPTGHGALIAADWLGDHDDHVRERIFRHGVQATPGTVPDQWRDAGLPAHHVHLKGEDTPRFLRGQPGFIGEPDLPESALQNGPERYELFHGYSGTGRRPVVRYTHGGITLHAPLPSGALRAIGDAWIKRWHADNPDSVQEPWNHWHSAAELEKWYEDNQPHRPVHLARVKLAPPIGAYHMATGESANIHHVHDEKGQKIASVKVVKRYGYETPTGIQNRLHVTWIGRPPGADGANSLGPDTTRHIADALAAHYPDATHFSGDRVSGARKDLPIAKQEVVKPIRRRPIQLARPDESNYNALVTRIRALKHSYATRENKQPTDTPDGAPHAAFADWLMENGVPGAHVVAGHAANEEHSTFTSPMSRYRARFGNRGTAGPIVEMSDAPRHLLGSTAYDHEGQVVTTGTSPPDFMKTVGESPMAQIIAGPKGAGMYVMVLHHNPVGDWVVHGVHAKTVEDVRKAVADFPAAARAKIMLPLDDRHAAAFRNALTGKGSRNVKLARMQAAPGGNPTIVNNMAYRSGQFIAKARQRIRDVAAKLVKLAREPAPFTADTSARGLFGRSPHDEAEERPLTLGELKGIEKEHELPEHHLLSPHVYQPDDAKGEDHPYTASNEDIRWFIHNVSRAALPEPRVRKLLADKKLPTGAKLAHLLANMKADYDASNKGADGSGGSWYEGQINELERHLHSATGGKDHPLWGSMGKDGQLVGKHAPEENHPGVVLFKALLSATSGAQNPVDNTMSAARAWAAGRRRGHPILDMPTYNEDSKEEWLNKARRLNHITPTDYEKESQLRNPGTTQEQRARWYNTFVKPHAGELDNEMGGAPAGYAASEARINPDHSTVWELDGGGNKVKHGGADVRGTSFAAKLPLVHKDGSLKTKGWGTRGEQAASGISSLKALFHVAKAELPPQATEAEQFRWVARWLLHDHDAKDFAHVQETLKTLGVNLPDLGENTFDYKKHGAEGWFAKGERVPGMFILGPKFGAFGMNLNSNSPHVAAKYRRFLTADMWFSRNWARYLGQMFRPGKEKRKTGETNPETGKPVLKTVKVMKPTETPTANDRRQMAVAIHKLCTDLGIHPADLQADLWYHEQSLYRMLGQDAKRTVSVSYADAARKWLDRNSPHALKDRDGKPIKLAKGTK